MRRKPRLMAQGCQAGLAGRCGLGFGSPALPHICGQQPELLRERTAAGLRLLLVLLPAQAVPQVATVVPMLRLLLLAAGKGMSSQRPGEPSALTSARPWLSSATSAAWQQMTLAVLPTWRSADAASAATPLSWRRASRKYTVNPSWSG